MVSLRIFGSTLSTFFSAWQIIWLILCWASLLILLLPFFIKSGAIFPTWLTVSPTRILKKTLLCALFWHFWQGLLFLCLGVKVDISFCFQNKKSKGSFFKFECFLCVMFDVDISYSFQNKKSKGSFFKFECFLLKICLKFSVRCCKPVFHPF